MKCCIYSRVSTPFDSQKGSLKTQRELLLDYAKQHNWEVYDIYEDIHTATKGNRTDFERMIADAEDGKFEIILAKDVSRLVRSFEAGHKLKKLNDDYGTHLVTYDNFVNTVTGDLRFFPLFVFFAELHSQELSDKIKLSTLNKAKNGKFVGSIPPYGYYKDEKTQKLYIKDDETPNIVRRIFTEYISGRGFDTIAKGLTADGIPTPRKKSKKGNAADHWQGSTIRLILENRNYSGDLVQCKTATTSVTSKKRLHRNADEFIVVENTHDAIISRETFLLVQSIIEAKKKKNVKQNKHLYSNILTCVDCGHGMHYVASRKGYVCGTYNKRGKEYCTSHVIKESKLNDYLLDSLNNLISNLPNFSSISGYSFTSENNKFSKKHTKILNNITAAETKRKNLTAKFANDGIIKEAYEELYTDISNEISHLKDTATKYKVILDNMDENIISKLIDETTISASMISEITPDVLRRFVSNISINSNGDVENIDFNFD